MKKRFWVNREKNEILEKVISKKELAEEEKFKILCSKIIDTKVIEYLMRKLSNLHIKIYNRILFYNFFVYIAITNTK